VKNSFLEKAFSKFNETLFMRSFTRLRFVIVYLLQELEFYLVNLALTTTWNLSFLFWIPVKSNGVQSKTLLKDIYRKIWFSE